MGLWKMIADEKNNLRSIALKIQTIPVEFMRPSGNIDLNYIDDKILEYIKNG